MISQLKKNISYSLVWKFISVISNFVLTAVLLGYLGASDYGTWSIFYSVITVMLVFDMGVGNKFRNDLTASIGCKSLYTSIYSELIVINGYISLLLCIIAILFYFILGFENYYIVFLLLGVVSIFLNSPNISYLSTHKAYVLEFVQAGINILFLLSILFIDYKNLFNQSKLDSIFSIFIILYVVIKLLFFLNTKEYISISVNMVVSVSHRIVERMMSSFSFFLAQLLFAVIIVFDRFFIYWFVGSVDTAKYDLIYKVYAVFMVFSLVAIRPLWSAISEASNKGKVKLVRRVLGYYYGALGLVVISLILTAVWMNEILSLWLSEYPYVSLNESLSVAIFFCGLIWAILNCYILNSKNIIYPQVGVFFVYIIIKLLSYLMLNTISFNEKVFLDITVPSMSIIFVSLYLHMKVCKGLCYEK